MKLEKQDRSEIQDENKKLPNQWQIIDINSEEGGKQIKKLEKEGVTFLEEIYNSSVLELKNLYDGYGHELDTKESLVKKCVNACLLKENNELSENQIINIFKDAKDISDIFEFKKRILEHSSSDEIVETESRWIYDANNKIAFKYIGHEAHRILQDSRTIGLIPLEATDKLRNLKIRCMGVSAASPAIDALVAAGAEDIEMWDGGKIDPSNQPRFVGMMGDIRNVGRPKAEVMMEMLRYRNPYGHYESHCGKVVAEENGDKESISFKKFFKGADLVVEVVDDVYIKSIIDKWARENSPDTLILFMADVGHRPIAGLSIPRFGNHFNQINLTEEDIQKMGDRESGIHPLDLVEKMIGVDMPQAHKEQFEKIRCGIMPYWSQTPDASRESASLVTKLVLAYLSGYDVIGKNYSSVSAPVDLMNKLSDENVEITKGLTKRVSLI